MALVVQHPKIAQSQTQKTEMPIGDSSFLQNVTYDSQSLQMTVVMKNGSQYLYHMVYPNVMEQWMQSPDKDAFYNQVIKRTNQSTKIVDKTTGPKVKGPVKKERS